MRCNSKKITNWNEIAPPCRTHWRLSAVLSVKPEPRLHWVFASRSTHLPGWSSTPLLQPYSDQMEGNDLKYFWEVVMTEKQEHGSCQLIGTVVCSVYQECQVYQVSIKSESSCWTGECSRSSVSYQTFSQSCNAAGESEFLTLNLDKSQTESISFLLTLQHCNEPFFLSGEF